MGKRLFVIYDQDELPVCVGHAEECAKFLGQKNINYIYRMAKHKNKLNMKYTVELVERS